MKAFFCREERYTKLSICFDSAESKKLICGTVDELVKKYELDPFVDIECSGGEEKGEFVVEFSDDPNQEARPLIDELCEKLGLEFELSCNTECSL